MGALIGINNVARVLNIVVEQFVETYGYNKTSTYINMTSKRISNISCEKECFEKSCLWLATSAGFSENNKFTT